MPRRLAIFVLAAAACGEPAEPLGPTLQKIGWQLEAIAEAEARARDPEWQRMLREMRDEERKRRGDHPVPPRPGPGPRPLAPT
jgi:hypothetical protein